MIIISRVSGTLQRGYCGQLGWACQLPSQRPVNSSASCLDRARLHSNTTISRLGSC